MKAPWASVASFASAWQPDELMSERTFGSSPLKVFEVAQRTSCSGYDSEFIALAEHSGTKLVTYDAALLAGADSVACTPAHLV